MSNWLIKCTEDYLVPVYNVLKKRLVQHTVLHADETTLQVLHEEGDCGQKVGLQKEATECKQKSRKK